MGRKSDGLSQSVQYEDDWDETMNPLRRGTAAFAISKKYSLSVETPDLDLRFAALANAWACFFLSASIFSEADPGTASRGDAEAEKCRWVVKVVEGE